MSGDPALAWLAGILAGTILPRRYHLRPGGWTIDVLVRDRRLVGYRCGRGQAGGATRPISAAPGRAMLVPLLRALQGCELLPDDAVTVHRLDADDTALLARARATGLAAEDILALLAAADEAMPEPEPEPAVEAPADEAPEPEVEPEPEPASPAPAAAGRPAGLAPRLERFMAQLPADAGDVAVCHSDGTVRRPADVDADADAGDGAPEAALRALGAALGAWEARLAGAGEGGARLICAIGPSRDSAAMVCAVEDGDAVVAALSFARVGLLFGPWLQAGGKA